MEKGSLKHQCGYCGTIFYLRSSVTTFGQWSGKCPDGGAVFVGNGRPQEKPVDVKITCVRMGCTVW